MSIFDTLDLNISVSGASGASLFVVVFGSGVSDLFSSRFFFLAAARACNLDILGGPDDPPSKPAPRTRGGLTKTVLRDSGTFNHGMSAKKLAQEDLDLVVVAQALQGSASEAPVCQGKSMEGGTSE